ncbi:CSC1-like protein 2, partial [Diaphorina citri]|uniref:CSC1-like protein 2 n=1 Tax=Diaphorina citri TaxID=121845 RepID=A0A3Q0J3G5_DIACI
MWTCVSPYVNAWNINVIMRFLHVTISKSILALLFFTLLRKRAWDYGRLALVQKNERWTQLFYGSLDEAVAVNPSDTRPPHTIPTLETSISVDQGPFSWLTSVFRIRDEHILVKSGADAVQYLSFQRHIIVFTAIITLVSLLVVLPVNFHGDLEGDGLTFGHTTLSNLHPESQLLWIHVTLAILYLPLSIFLMRRFSVHLKIEEREAVSKTLMITNIPRRNCDVNDIQRHFRESYPEFDVQDIQLAYDIARLVTLDRRREILHESKFYCEESIKTCHERLQVTPRICGYLCKPCCYPCPRGRQDIEAKWTQLFYGSLDEAVANPILSEFMPTLLMWTFAAMLPVLVVKSDQWLGHWTRSEMNHAIMRKTFT